ncbi:MAG: sigma 54-interacting transcriptional regulator [Ignavibacteria bacterium]|nr:sigma 54-interacting transcriptional regulator [Ignavibacteria bacterium]
MTQESRSRGISPFAKRLGKQIQKLAQSREDVLIIGEASTGKRTIALDIHNERGRKRPFILLDASSVPDVELRAVLAGSEAEVVQAVTGRKPASLADQATLTIADADKLVPHNQAMLASFLKEGRKKFTGLRIIVTLLEPIERLAQSGALSLGLATYLDQFERIEVPALRERLEDIPALTASIVKQLSDSLGSSVKEIDENTTHILSQGQWPGNTRQLMGVLGKAIMISHEDKLVLPSDFLNEHQHLEDAIGNITSGKVFVLDQTLDLIEKLLIQRGLKQFMYNQSKTAQIFGLSEANFRYRLKKFGLPRMRKKV